MTPTVLDAGALIAHERGERRMDALIELAAREGRPLVTSAAVVAQVWRGDPRQARLHRLLAAAVVDEVALDAEDARSVGQLCADAGTADVVDGHVALLTQRFDATVVTSDADDLEALGVAPDRLSPI